MYDDIGLILGTGLVCFFGLVIAIGFPLLIQRQSSDDDLPFDRAVAIRWMRILGWALVLLSGVQLVIFAFL